MLQETWNTFPRQIVQKINGLLDQAQPKALKAFHIYKMCKDEGLWDKSFSEFSFLLEGFYQAHPVERSKSLVDQFLNRPMDWRSYESLNLTFQTAEIHLSQVRDIASWAHHMLRLKYEKTSQISDVDTLTQALCDLTQPQFGEKDQNFDFEDFCQAWKARVDKLYGKKYELEHQAVLFDLRRLHEQQEAQVLDLPRRSLLERIYLSQTEIDWVERSLKAVQENLKMPNYPLSRGPNKEPLIDLLKWLTLWEISKTIKQTHLKDKIEKLRSSIEQECKHLLATCRR